MTAAIFNAIGRGYQARYILNAIGRQAPGYQNTINNLYMAGYTADRILNSIANKTDKKNYDPDMFLTEHEKVQKRDKEQKTKAYMTVAAVGGTAALAAAGAYALMKRNQAIQPSAIYPAPPKRKQIGAPQKQAQLPYIAPTSPQSPTPPSQPIAPMPQAAQNAPAQAPSAPSPPPPTVSKTAELLKGLKEDTRMSNLIDGGYDLATTTAIYRAAAPKNVLSILEKAEGGLEKVVSDYTQYLREAKDQLQQQQQEQQAPQNFSQMAQSTIQKKPEEQTNVMNEFIKAQQPQQVQGQPVAPQQEASSVQPQEVLPIQPIQPASKPLVSLKNGQIGELESEKNHVAEINVNGQLKKEKLSNVTKEPPDIEQAVREVVNSIPENMKSTQLQSMVYIPGMNVMLSQFYGGKWAYYLDFPEDTYKSISLGTYEPKGQGVTGIAEYKPGVADSRGAGFHQEVKLNPKYSKENQGVTWGYADNEYSLLKHVDAILHKISKERYDAEGNLITPKPRAKKQPKGSD